MQWIATCPHETVEVLAQEIIALGIKAPKVLHRGVAFEADLETAYRAHLLLRTASRIQRVVAEFPVINLQELDKELRKIIWPEWLRSQHPFSVSMTLTDAAAQAMGENNIIRSVIQSVQRASFEKGAPRYDPDSDHCITLFLFIRKGSCVLGIDTAGRALHKRGWRKSGHPAVLKETFAAAILLMAGYTGAETLLDPLCGSGTLAIEAAYIALKKAPLIHRGKDDFALEHLAGFDRNLWRRVSDQLRAEKKNEIPYPIFASDLRSEYVELAQASALRARVEKYLQFSVKPFQQWEPPTPQGLLVANLPYGERIGAGELQKLYREMGDVIRQRFAQWRIALLVPKAAPIEPFSLQSPRVFPLMNGALPVKLLLSP
jgi:putative N6-adenine-specific DNA methylase